MFLLIFHERNQIIKKTIGNKRGHTIQNLKIEDYLVGLTPVSNVTYQKTLNIAMKKEKVAFHLYHDLVSSTDSQQLRSLFLCLTQEKEKNKLLFHIEYDGHNHQLY